MLQQHGSIGDLAWRVPRLQPYHLTVLPVHQGSSSRQCRQPYSPDAPGSCSITKQTGQASAQRVKFPCYHTGSCTLRQSKPHLKLEHVQLVLEYMEQAKLEVRSHCMKCMMRWERTHGMLREMDGWAAGASARVSGVGSCNRAGTSSPTPTGACQSAAVGPCHSGCGFRPAQSC